MEPVTTAELRASATVDLMTAAAALGIGRTKAYDLARRGEFPCRVIRIGEVYCVPTPGLLELLGVPPEDPPRSGSAPPGTGDSRDATTSRYDSRRRIPR